MSISVVIPHLNQLAALGHCLEALHAQAGDLPRVEILVVDNGSRTSPEALCAAYPDVTLLIEDGPGPGPARNRGAAAARGEILAFIDADCVAHPDWLATIGRIFAQDPDLQIAGGAVEVPLTPGRAATGLEAYERVFGYRIEDYIRHQGFAGTGNLALRRAVFDRVGPFRGIHVAEDWDWGQRAGAGGYPIRFVPGMVVSHPARTRFAELAQKWDRHIAHNFEMLERGPLRSLRWIGRALAVGLSPAAEIGRVIRSPRLDGRGERWRAFLVLIRIRLYRAGRMLGVLAAGNAHALSEAWNRR